MKPIWPWLFPVFVIAAACYVAGRSYPWWHGDDLFDKYFPVGFGIFLTAVAVGLTFALGCGLACFIGAHSTWEWQKCWTPKMVSLRSADGASGRFGGGIFIMAGYVDTKQTYFYYTQNKDGSFAPHRWTPDGLTRIYEEDRKDGEVVQWDKHFTHGWVYWFAVPDGDVAMDFYIPKGSLQQSFQLQ